MKKLIIAAAVTMLGIVANAAQATWSVDYTYQKGTTDAAEGWQMMFFDDAQVARATFIANLASDAYLTDISNYAGLASDLTDSDGYADGYAKKTTYGNPETITGYFVLFDSADASTATYAYVSETMEATTGATAGQIAQFLFGDVTATQNAANWTAVNAPEPTSGLLLLLGMAGLALKRKRT